MITVNFIYHDKHLKGFEISGHAGYADCGEDIVCAGVSSAVMLAVNMIIDGFNVKSDVTDSGESISFTVKEVSSEAETVLNILYQHINALSSEYKGTIKIENLEV